MIETAPAPTDTDLLSRYARQQDEGAFAQLVRRHQAMVLGVAVRRTGDVEMARDVAQQVFVLLARKAAQLLRHDRLAGWLYQTASYEAAKIQKSEWRRLSRHADFAVVSPAENPCDEQWQALEEAMAALGGSERDAIVMHYYRDCSYAEMAAAAALSETAMRKRVSRALENLSRQLQRQGLSVPAVALLTSAVAMQTTVPVQASLATSALAASGQVHVLAWIQWGTLMTTNTALKTTAAVAILAAAPLVWQTTENAGLRAEVARLEQHQPPAEQRQPAAIEDGSTGGIPSNPSHLAAAQARLQTLRDQRAAATAGLASLRAEAAKLKNEVVVSLGRVDEVAAKVAQMQILAMGMEKLEGQKEAQEKLALKLLEGTSELMPLMAELRQFSADSKLTARMAATTTAKVAGVSDAVRDEMERRLLRHYEQMKNNRLTLDNRPTVNRADWDRRYGEASAAAMRDIENLLPASLRETAMWKSQTSAQAEGHLNFLDALFGESSPPPQPPAKAPAGNFLVEP